MPAPASEDDLKRRARRRLIGAVVLTLAAVILLPLLLEDEPPPASQLEVHMPPASAMPEPLNPAPQLPVPQNAEKSEAQPALPTATPAELKPPVKSESKPAPQPAAKRDTKPKVEAKPAAHSEANPLAFVVQLGAFSDAQKVATLNSRVRKLGLPAYTDKSGTLTRFRVGPFPSHEAAAAAAAKLAEAGLAGKVMVK